MLLFIPDTLSPIFVVVMLSYVQELATAMMRGKTQKTGLLKGVLDVLLSSNAGDLVLSAHQAGFCLLSSELSVSAWSR